MLWLSVIQKAGLSALESRIFCKFILNQDQWTAQDVGVNALKNIQNPSEELKAVVEKLIACLKSKKVANPQLLDLAPGMLALLHYITSNT